MSKNMTAKERLAAKAVAKGFKPKAEEKPVKKNLFIVANEANLRCVELIAMGQRQEAFKYGQEALKNFLKATKINPNGKTTNNISFNQGLSEIYYNLALTKQNEASEGALEYLSLAHKFNPSDQDIIYKQWFCNFLNGDYDKSIEVAEKLDTPMKGLLIIKSNLYAEKITLGMASVQATKFVDKAKDIKEKQWFFEIIFYIELKAGNYERALSLLKTSQEHIDPNQITDLAIIVHNSVAIYCVAGKFAEGLKYLEAMHAAHPKLGSCDITYAGIYYEFLLYEYTGNKDKATALLNKINQSAQLSLVYKKIPDQANQARFFNNIEEGNFEAARLCLDKTSLNKNFYTKLINYHRQPILSNVADLPKALSLELPYDEELAVAIIESEAAIAHPEEDAVRFVVEALSFAQKEGKPQILEKAPLVEVWKDPRAIHAYCQHKKAMLKKKVISEFSSQDKAESSWVLSDKEKISADQDNVYKVYNSENYYVYIEDGVCKQEHRKAFVDAIINKGMIHRKVGQNGIKYCLGNNLAEVKIDADARIWTDLTLCNDEGKYLVVIKESGNHDGFKIAARKGKMEIRKVSSYIMHIEDDMKAPYSKSEHEDEISLGDDSLENKKDYEDDVYPAGDLQHSSYNLD